MHSEEEKSITRRRLVIDWSKAEPLGRKEMSVVVAIGDGAHWVHLHLDPGETIKGGGGP